MSRPPTNEDSVRDEAAEKYVDQTLMGLGIDEQTTLDAFTAGWDACAAIKDAQIELTAGMFAAAAEENKILREALQRIKMFNPSYEYTFENARSIVTKAIELYEKDVCDE